jgi:aspartyl-tRNA(Asn)/glutamyl-tRNA(Gln) amidotransferase subunit C
MQEHDTSSGTRTGTNGAAPPLDAALALERVARLARLDLAGARRERLAGDLARVLAAFESLASVDVAGVEPLHQPLVGPGTTRDTRRSPTEAALPRESLLANAPDAQTGFFGVPKTVAE